MDDLDGLFSSGAPASPATVAPGPQHLGFPPANNIPAPVTQMGVSFPGQQMPGLSMPGQQVPIMPGPMVTGQQQSSGTLPMMTPTQTQAASQLNNKTQILNQFQSAPGAPATAVGGMMAPPRPAPRIPGQQQQMPQQFVQQQQLPPQQQDGFGDGFLQSLSVTEPMPQEFDNMFEAKEGGDDAVDGGSNPFGDVGGTNDQNDQVPPEVQSEVLAVEEAKEEDKVEEGQIKESSDQSERKTSFWSGLWNRNKDHGSKENMLEDAGAEKKDLDDGKLIIIISSIQAEL